MLNIKITNNLAAEELAEMEARWRATASAVHLTSEIAESIYDQLVFEYNDWSRNYHNLSHIWSLLQLAQQYKEEIEQYALLELAIWFHDYIYKAKRQDNEAQSAHWAEELLGPHLPAKSIQHIKALILSTAGHEPRLKANADQLWFLDFDLAILASDRATYKAYAEAIREEYKSWYSFFVYNAGRKKVMKTFLKRKTLYFTQEFQEKYEQKARENVKWEIAGLKES